MRWNEVQFNHPWFTLLFEYSIWFILNCLGFPAKVILNHNLILSPATFTKILIKVAIHSSTGWRFLQYYSLLLIDRLSMIENFSDESLRDNIDRLMIISMSNGSLWIWLKWTITSIKVFCFYSGILDEIVGLFAVWIGILTKIDGNMLWRSSIMNLVLSSGLFSLAKVLLFLNFNNIRILFVIHVFTFFTPFLWLGNLFLLRLLLAIS